MQHNNAPFNDGSHSFGQHTLLDVHTPGIERTPMVNTAVQFEETQAMDRAPLWPRFSHPTEYAYYHVVDRSVDFPNRRRWPDANGTIAPVSHATREARRQEENENAALVEQFLDKEEKAERRQAQVEAEALDPPVNPRQYQAGMRRERKYLTGKTLKWPFSEDRCDGCGKRFRHQGDMWSVWSLARTKPIGTVHVCWTCVKRHSLCAAATCRLSVPAEKRNPRGIRTDDATGTVRVGDYVFPCFTKE